MVSTSFHLPSLDAHQALLVHSVFETLAFALGGYLWRRTRRGAPLLTGRGPDFPAIVGCLVGAMVGSKLANWIQDPGPIWSHGVLRLPGQSMVGGLLGAWIGIELAKKSAGIRQSTGDAFAYPMLWGLSLGRIGCFFAGLHEDTYGLPTSLPWGVDLGDGIPRHPAPLYEIAFLLVLRLSLGRLPETLACGVRFRLCAAAYLAWRLSVEFLKPSPWKALGLSGLQWICLAGLAWCAFELRSAFAKARP